MEVGAYFHPGLSWLVVTVISAMVHALIYGVVFKALHYLTLGQAVILLIIVLGCIALWIKSRSRRGW